MSFSFHSNHLDPESYPKLKTAQKLNNFLIKMLILNVNSCIDKRYSFAY